MASRSALLKRVNEELAEDYNIFREECPNLNLPAFETFPLILGMTVGEVAHSSSVTAITLEVRVGEDEVFRVSGVAVDDGYSSGCNFHDAPDGLQKILEMFAGDLIFNIMCEEDVELANWQDLSE